MATKMESGTNSPESEYYSLPGDSDGEEEPTTTIKRKPLDIEREPVIEPGILGTIVARLDSSEEILSTVTPDVRILLCVNAARVMLGQVCLGDSPTNILNRFKGQRLLNLILAICAEWEGADLNMPELLALPLFGAAMEEVEHERLPCSLDAFQALVEEIAERPSAAVISGDNDTIAVLSLCDQLTDGFIVFNPRCRQSPDMTGMSFRLFTDRISTAKHIQNLISVYRGITQTHSSKFSASSFSSSGSSGPMTSPPIHNMYTAWTFVPTQYINVGGHLSKFPGSSDDGQVLHGSQRTIFEANLDLLKHKVELSSTNFGTQDLKRELKNLERSLGIEEEREKKANEDTMTYKRLIEETQEELSTAEAVVAAALEGGVHLYAPAARKSEREYDQRKQEEEQSVDGIYPWAYSRRGGYDNSYTSSAKGKRRDSAERKGIDDEEKKRRDNEDRKRRDDEDRKRRDDEDRKRRDSEDRKRRDNANRKDNDGDSFMMDDYGEGESIPFQPLNSGSTQNAGSKTTSYSRQYATPYSYGPGNASYGAGNASHGADITSYRASNTSYGAGNTSYGAGSASYGARNASYQHSANLYGAGNGSPSGADATIEKWRRQASTQAIGNHPEEEEIYEMNMHSAASVEKRKREQRGTERQERYREEPTRQSRKGMEKPEERRNISFEFQTQLADDEASRLLAIAIAQEEENRLLEFRRLQEAYKTFDCPICGDTFDQGDAAQAERCDHVVCRGCMLGHIKAQIEEAHWPIFCGMCTSDLANRGVVTRRVAEVVGANEDLIVGWNRMELGGVSVILECPRCRESTRVDSEDFRAAELLDCPLGCGAHWCKDCHQEVEKGQKHSCDGQAEMDNLAQAQGWKQCPGCSTYCMKNGGCNQLSCKTPGCNMHFCYACGGKIAQTASVNEMIAAKTAHYATCKLW